MSDPPAAPRWRVLLSPRWVCWHLFAVLAVGGMLWLGDWQFRRAEAGNALSWAYTFEWPVFAVFGVVFWIKTIRDELRPAVAGGERPGAQIPAGTGQLAGSGQAQPGAGVAAGPEADPAAGPAGADAGDEGADTELAEYNAYLAKLNAEVRGHGRWHGFR